MEGKDGNGSATTGGVGESTGTIEITGSGQDQVDALKLFAYSRGIPGAPKPRLKLPGDNRPEGMFAKAFWMTVRERGVFRRDVQTVFVNEESKRLDFADGHMLKMWGDGVVELFRTRMKHVNNEPHFYDVTSSMTVDLARGLLAQIKVTPELIAGVDKINYAPMPVMRKNGAIEILPNNYDVASRTFTFDAGFKLEEMALDEAVKQWRDFYREFPFGDGIDDPERSIAVLMAEQLTLFANGLLPDKSSRPMFVHNANTQRSGKTLTAETSLFAVFGEAISIDWIENHEEFRKELNTQAGSAAPYIFFDNVKSSLSNAVLEKFITGSTISFRLMGKNTEVVKVPNVSTVIVTSNNVVGSTDIAERALYVNLYVAQANAQDRKIESPMDKSKLLDVAWRQKMLSILWTIVKNWDRAGRPVSDKRLAGFEAWSEIIGGMVVAAGFANPLIRPKIAGNENSDDAQMALLVKTLASAERGDPGVVDQDFDDLPDGKSFTFSQLTWRCAHGGLFERFVPDDNDLKAKDRSAFGKFLRKWLGRGRSFMLEDADGSNRRVVVSHNGETGRASRFIVTEA